MMGYVLLGPLLFLKDHTNLLLWMLFQMPMFGTVSDHLSKKKKLRTSPLKMMSNKHCSWNYKGQSAVNTS